MINENDIEKLMILMIKYNVNKIKVKNKDILFEINKKYYSKKNDYENEYKTKICFRKIKSPLVGVFYLTPGPNQKPFIKEGDIIKKGDIVCIIEVMKTLHQIKSDYSGLVSKIIVKNEMPVEYNEDLIIVKDV